MHIQELIKFQAMKLREAATGGALGDRFIDGLEEPQVRQMCAKVSPELVDRLDAVCAALKLSKRRFIEAAVATAVEHAEKAIEAAINDPQGSL